MSGLFSKLFGFLLNLFVPLFTRMMGIVSRIWDASRELTSRFLTSALGRLVIILSPAIALYASLRKVIAWIADRISLLKGSGLGDPIGGQVSFADSGINVLSVFNSAIALDELIVIITALLALWGGVLLYRTIKSWIPTVS